MHVRNRLLGLAAAVACGLVASQASAQEMAGNPCLYGYGGYGLYYNIYGWETVPYYAMHPPVYYSFPVARPYGYSPFAYPPGTLTPEVDPIEAEVLINPHVDPAPVEPMSDRSAKNGSDLSRVLVVVNPYVDTESQIDTVQAPSSGPQVVYPAKAELN